MPKLTASNRLLNPGRVVSAAGARPKRVAPASSATPRVSSVDDAHGALRHIGMPAPLTTRLADPPVVIASEGSRRVCELSYCPGARRVLGGLRPLH